MSTEPIVILGTGLAGYSLAREFRKLDQNTPLALITADHGGFYSKPMLSNALAQGRTPDQLVSFGVERMAADLRAEIHPHTRIDAIDLAGCHLTSDKGTFSYGRLVLASGAQPIRPPMTGDAVTDVLSINNLDDYRRFRAALATAKRVLILGPGLIGCEFANDLVSQGHAVSVVGPDPYPVSTLLPEAAGLALQRGLIKLGVDWHLGALATSVVRDAQAIILTLDNGKQLRGDLVLSAIGLRPDMRLADACGLAVARGIQSDRWLQTSQPNVYALGDCAEVAGRNLPFVMPLMHGARALARTLAGEPTEVKYPVMPVVIKTPAHPVVVSPPARGIAGDWEVRHSGEGIEALYRTSDGGLAGFALTGTATAKKQALLKQVPAVLD